LGLKKQVTFRKKQIQKLESFTSPKSENHQQPPCGKVSSSALTDKTQLSAWTVSVDGSVAGTDGFGHCAQA
jgi:hypothetical protein